MDVRAAIRNPAGAGHAMDPSPPEPRKSRLAGAVTLGLAVLVAVGVSWYLFAPGDGSSAGSNAPGGPTPVPNTGPLDTRRPEIGKPAPDFALVDARDGVTIRKLSDFRGKGVIVNWYASWCNPCRAEMPDFMAALDALPGELAVLGVDFMESRNQALEILDDLNATYPAVLDSAGVVADQWRVGAGLPTTFFVDKEGILRGMKTGRVTPLELEQNLAKLGLNYAAPAR